MTRPLGKGEVESSILSCSTIIPQENKAKTPSAPEGIRAGLRVNDSGTVAENWQGLPGYDDPTTLYRYYDADGALLYVGIARSHHVRDAAHFVRSHWRLYSAFVRVEVYPTRDLAEIAEAHAIEKEEPQHNAKWPGTMPPDGLKRDWYLHKMGGLRGECVGWRVTGCDWPATLTPCDPPDWWDDARVFFIPYTGKKPKWQPKPEPEDDGFVKINWGPK